MELGSKANVEMSLMVFQEEGGVGNVSASLTVWSFSLKL